MRKLILKMSVSFDGFVGGPNGEIDWFIKTTTSWILGTLWQAGVHIMGSRTFCDMAAYWPYADEPLTHLVVLAKGLSIFSDLPKPMDLSWISSTVLSPGVIVQLYRPVYQVSPY